MGKPTENTLLELEMKMQQLLRATQRVCKASCLDLWGVLLEYDTAKFSAHKRS